MPDPTHLEEALLVLVTNIHLLNLPHRAELAEIDGAAGVCEANNKVPRRSKCEKIKVVSALPAKYWVVACRV